jgi:polyadenylation factor subunit 2
MILLKTNQCFFVSFSSSFLKMIERRTWQRDFRDKRALQPDVTHQPNLLPPMDYLENPANAATTK